MKFEAAGGHLATKPNGVTFVIKCMYSGTLALSPPFCLIILETARQERMHLLDTKIV
jgi:hypothetical protein